MTSEQVTNALVDKLRLSLLRRTETYICVDIEVTRQIIEELRTLNALRRTGDESIDPEPRL